MFIEVYFRHCYGHIGDRQKPGAGRQSPTLFDRLQGVFEVHATIDSYAHHQAFVKPVRHHWYMSTPQQPTHTGFEPGTFWSRVTDPMCVTTEWNTCRKPSMNYQFTSRQLTLDNLSRSNQGHMTFKRLHLLNGASCYQILHETHNYSKS